MIDYGATEPIGNMKSTETSPNGYDAMETVGGPGNTIPSSLGYDATQPSSNLGSTETSPNGYNQTQPSDGNVGYGSPGKPPYYERGQDAIVDPGPTIPLFTSFNPGSVIDESARTPTGPVFEGDRIYGAMPVVGWLVCVDGPEKGRDYRLHEGYNSIGRSPNMDVCIYGDNSITRKKDAMVAYDPDEKKYYFAPAEAINLVKLNGKTVMMANEIHAYDVLQVGTSKLMFVPFCGEQFNWGKEK